MNAWRASALLLTLAAGPILAAAEIHSLEPAPGLESAPAPKLSGFRTGKRVAEPVKLLDGHLPATVAVPLSTPPEVQSGHTLMPRLVFTDPLGIQHTRATHWFEGVRVWASEAAWHVDAQGRRLPDPAPAVDLRLEEGDEGGLCPVPIHLDLKPGIALPETHPLIREHLGSAGAGAEFQDGEKVIFPLHRILVPELPPEREPNAADTITVVEGHRLAWLVRVRAGDGRSWDYLVDAHAGQVLACLPVERSGTAPSVGQGKTFHYGKVALNTTRLDDHGRFLGYTLVDSTRGKGGFYSGNAVNQWEPRWGKHGRMFIQRQDVWGNGKPGPPGSRDLDELATNAAEAAYSLQCAWDYFLNIHGRLGWDGKGTPVVLQIATGAPEEKAPYCDNAVWMPDQGGIAIFPGEDHLPSTDIFTVTHELAHGVTQATAGLVSLKGSEAAALNEASSDIFGLLAETYEWCHRCRGQQIGTPKGWGLFKTVAATGHPKLVRSLRHPRADGQSPNYWKPGLARLDEHHACGPMSRAFYYLVQGTGAGEDKAGLPSPSSTLPEGMAGIGTDKAAAIWYRALTVYLKPRSTYLDALRACLQAAADLFGPESPERLAVAQAFQAINVGKVPRAAVTPEEVRADLAGETLTFSSAGDRIQSVLYHVDGQQVGHAASPPYRCALDTPRLLRNGRHTWEATLILADGAIHRHQGSFHLANRVQQFLLDPGFDWPCTEPWGPDRWQTGRDADPVRPRAGEDYARFQGRRASLSQKVVIPPGLREARLTFLGHISASAADRALDSLTVEVVDSAPAGSAGRLPDARRVLTGAEGWEDWVPFDLELPALAGLAEAREVEVRLGFRPVHADAVFRIDELRLLGSEAPMPRLALCLPKIRLRPGGETFLDARFLNADDPRVTWTLREADGGTLFSGRYTAPDRPGWYHAVATANADSRYQAEASIHILEPEPKQ